MYAPDRTSPLHNRILQDRQTHAQCNMAQFTATPAPSGDARKSLLASIRSTFTSAFEGQDRVAIDNAALRKAAELVASDPKYQRYARPVAYPLKFDSPAAAVNFHR
jgi:hypothetical protein